MTQLVLIRHGETNWNREGRWQGQEDVSLNAVGLVQSSDMARALKCTLQLDAIYASDLLRARQTAEALVAVYQLPVIIDPRLREIHQGEWQGLQVAEIVNRYGDLFLARSENPWSVAPPGGETAYEVRVRMGNALSEIAARHPDGVVAIVSHGFALAVARTIPSRAQAGSLWELVPANCAPLMMDWDCAGQNEPK